MRTPIPDGSATAKAIDYNLNRWVALVRLPTQPASRISELLLHRWQQLQLTT